MAPMTAPEPTAWHELPHAPPPGTLLGQRASLADGSAHMGVWPPDAGASVVKPFRYLLLRSGDAVHAFVNRCAHFGVPLAQKQEQLLFQPHTSLTCNVHYARYDWRDGHCLGGDCDGAGLWPIPVQVDADGQIRIAP